MKPLRLLLLFLPLCVLAACGGNHVRPDIAAQVNVFGITLSSATDYREIEGVRGVEEPCLNGYERDFDTAGINIGYGFDRKIRKITTRNPRTAMFGISPGTPFAEGRERALKSGFSDTSQPYTFAMPGYALTFLVDGSGTIFGLTLERR